MPRVCAQVVLQNLSFYVRLVIRASLSPTFPTVWGVELTGCLSLRRPSVPQGT